MKLDPGMHIGLHLVFFGKTGVTSTGIKISAARAYQEQERAEEKN
jgi:hypothetical protein